MNSAYLRGQPIGVVARFFIVDPVTGLGTSANPNDMSFKVLDPNDVTTTYNFGDENVSNPSTGVFVLHLDPQSPVGAYKWRAASPDDDPVCVWAEEGAFDVIESGVLTPDPPKVAVDGPCSSWINGDDVAAAGADLGVGSDTQLLDDVAYEASALLYALSGRQYPGVCTRTVRPCAGGCGCWAGALWPASPGVGFYSWGGGALGGFGVGPYWVNDYAGLSCGCGGESYVKLAGYPVREILLVKIDGVPLPEFDPDTDARNWRLDQRNQLTRMWKPNGTNPTPQWWPGCQNISLDDDQPGTFSIQYTWGADAPALGRSAAAQLARELWLATNGKGCALPTKVTKIVRQGVTIERIVPIAQMLRQGSTGIQLVDAFIAQANPTGMIRRPMVWTPDDQQYAKKVGQ